MKEYCVSCDRMKELERLTDEGGLSYLQMMENAGRIATNRIVEITEASPIDDAESGSGTPAGAGASVAAEDATAAGVPKGPARPRLYPYALDRPLRVRVYCGKGNNGGDGLVVARRLKREGWDVEIVLVDGQPSTPDAVTNYGRLEGMEISVREISAEEVSVRENPAQGKPDPAGVKMIPDVIVDAIYGTGFHGQLRPRGAAAAKEIREAREAGARVFALDIPSGMGGDLTDAAELDPRCVKADVTITFHAKKAVHLQDFAGDYCGQVIVADIGILDPDQPEKGSASAAAASPGGADLSPGGAAESPGGADSSTGGSESTPGVEPVRIFEEGAPHSFDDLVAVIARLRAPDGCVWDRAQTHETLKKYLREETQEALDAIDSGDDENLCEELGDVLLQILLHAQIASEEDKFTIDDVIQGIADKMIRRHPWVFGDVEIDSIEENVNLWEEIKRREKEEKQKQ